MVRSIPWWSQRGRGAWKYETHLRVPASGATQAELPARGCAGVGGVACAGAAPGQRTVMTCPSWIRSGLLIPLSEAMRRHSAGVDRAHRWTAIPEIVCAQPVLVATTRVDVAAAAIPVDPGVVAAKVEVVGSSRAAAPVRATQALRSAQGRNMAFPLPGPGGSSACTPWRVPPLSLGDLADWRPRASGVSASSVGGYLSRARG